MKILKKFKGFISKIIFFRMDNPPIREEKEFLAESRREVLRAERLGIPSTIVKYHEKSPTYGFEIISHFLKEGDFKDFITFEVIRKLEFKLSDFTKYFNSFIRSFFKILKEIKKSYRELRENKKISPNTSLRYPNKELWNELREYAKNKWDIYAIGFTKVPHKLIFQNRYILYPYALVFLREMQKREIDTAPRIPAGVETIRTYAKLGEAVNDIARWLRLRGVKCQSNHPLGGLIVSPALAGKAGLGWQGKMGLLVSPEFGVRQRIAPIFIEDKIFEYTDSLKYKWIEEYCNSCNLCAKECPTQAILDKKEVHINNIEGIMQLKTCIDRPKCFKFFLLTIGCSVCIKVCPFSQGKGAYSKIKSTYEKF